jgi:ATP-dependent exoDNAse (exonuclease V) alpha subunit
VSNEIDGKRYVTTTEVLLEERRVVDLVRHGMGKHEKLGLDQGWAIRRAWLSAEQQAAVFHLLNSPDFVTGIRGAAGTGKSTMLREALEAVEHCSGKRLHAFAPSAEAVGVLRQEGFENATTIASLLVSPETQAALRGNLLLIDETGLTSIKDMRRVLDIAQAQGARVILCGDRNQHRAVERGDTLRILEKHAGLKSAQLVEIRRQQVQEYNEAVRDLHAGKAVKGFTKLERIGFIQQIEDLETRHAPILQTFLDLKELKHEDGRAHTVLIAAPTHAEIQEVTSRLRGALQERGIVSAANGTVKVRDRQGNERELRLEESEKWSLYERQAIGLAVATRFG